MLKEFLSISISVIMAIAIVSPIAFDLLDIKHEISFLEDIDEDQKEEKKELEVKDLLFFIQQEDNIAFSEVIEENRSFVGLRIQIHYLEITSPPPEA